MPRKNQTIDLWPWPFSLPLSPKMMYSPLMTSNVPVTKTLLDVASVSDTWIQGCKASCRGWALLKLLLFLLCCFFLINGAWEGSGKAVWHVPYAPTHCVCVCVCVLCVQTPSVWWSDTVWESVCKRRIHTQHKGPIMSPHSEKEKGGGRGDNRGLSISEGSMMVSLPLTLPSSFLSAPPQTNMCQQEVSMEEIPVEEDRPSI